MPALPELKFKPDFPKTAERFRAWWACSAVDRPLVTLATTPPRPARLRPSTHRTLRERWMDAEWNVDNAIARLEASEFPGDSLPFYMPNLGPEITATLFGCELEFGETTVWSRPSIHDSSGWRGIAAAEADFDNPYWLANEKMTRLALERADGRYLVGLTDLHGNYDILAALRDPQALCTDMIDCPDLVRKAGRRVAEGFVEALQRNWEIVRKAGHGSTTWLPFHHEGLAYASSSDFWGLVSHAMAREMVLPDLLTELKPLSRSIFHLDGPSALQHLDLLLDLPQIQAIQWVYGAGRGPAERWLGVYRRCLAAGKAVQVLAETPADALAALRELGPEGVWLWVAEPFGSLAEAEAFLAETAKASA
jgi:hypothetical protein